MATISLEEIGENENPIDTFPFNDFPSYKAILSMIESLPEGKVFKLAVLEGLSHKEISLLLNIAPHSSSSQLSRAKNMLRKLISQYCIIFGLFILSFIISIQIWLYTSKKTIITEQGITATRKEKIQKTEGIVSKDSTKTILNHASISSRHVLSKSIKNSPKQEVTLQDSVTGTGEKDSIKSSNHQIIEKQDIKEQKGLYRAYTSKQFSTDKKNWSLALSYSGGERQINTQKSRIPNDISSEYPKEILEKSYHHIPITLALSLRKNINEYWGIETGVQYTYLRSDFTIINDSYLEKTQKISYIGIPLKGSFKIWQQQKFSIYTSAGLTLDIPVKATLEELTSENRLIISQKKSRLYPHLQWSADFGIGIQYHITPSIGIYTEPNLRYYFNDGSRLNTIRATKPFNMTLPIGIRLSW